MGMTGRTGLGAVGVALAAALLSACAGTQQKGAMPSEPATPPTSSQAVSPEARPPLSSTKLPTMKPAKPPKTPTDLVPTDLVVGLVTRGGSGPCYGIVDQDGTEYAVYSTAGLSLREGMTVRVRFQQPERTVDCGAGRPIQAVHMTVLGS